MTMLPFALLLSLLALIFPQVADIVTTVKDIGCTGSVQWEVARFNATRRQSWFTRMTLLGYEE